MSGPVCYNQAQIAFQNRNKVRYRDCLRHLKDRREGLREITAQLVLLTCLAQMNCKV